MKAIIYWLQVIYIFFPINTQIYKNKELKSVKMYKQTNNKYDKRYELYRSIILAKN